MSDSLVAFLNARLAEDEAAAKAASEEFGVSGRWYRLEDAGKADLGIHGAQWAHIARHDPARVLREVTAKRDILKRYWRFSEGRNGHGGLVDRLTAPPIAAAMRPAMLDLAAVYSDHPDYRQEWAP